MPFLSVIVVLTAVITFCGVCVILGGFSTEALNLFPRPHFRRVDVFPDIAYPLRAPMIVRVRTPPYRRFF